MSDEEDTKLDGGLTKGESNASLFGEGIESQDGCSPSNSGEEPVSMDNEVPASLSNVSDSKSEGKPPRAPNLLQPRPSSVLRDSSAGRPAPVTRNSSADRPAPITRKTSSDRPTPIIRNSSTDRPAPITSKTSAEHARKGSIDEFSALSGLTDEGGEDIDFPFHQHSVSWDKGVENGSKDPGPSMQDLGTEMSNTAPPASSDLMSTPPQNEPSGRAKKNWGKLRDTVLIQQAIENDMNVKTVNPFETEAEAAILRALDRTRRKNAAKAGNILPLVSDEAAQAFKQDTTPEQNNLSKPKSSGDERSLLSGTATAASAATAAAGNAAHKRTKTLDDTLFDLANKMRDLQNAPDGSMHGNRERVFTNDSGGGRGRFFSEDAVAAEFKGNSGDVLVQNAAMLFRRPLTKKESVRSSAESSQEVPPPPPRVDASPSTTSGERRWSLINSQRSGDSRKKTDEPIIEGSESFEHEDVEMGIETGVGPPPDDTGESSPPGDVGGKQFRMGKAGKGAKRMFSRTNQEVKEDFETFRRFLQPRTGTIKFYLLFVVGFVIIPALVVAAILFHTGNPGLGREGASTSWFILFLVRQVITGTLAKATEVFVIDFLSLQLRLTVRVFGPIFTLVLVQSKGWPFIIFCWGIYNLCMNSGQNVFAQHWLFWQGMIGLFNADNPSGSITFSIMNYKINGSAVVVGFVVAIKRLWWGLYLGKRSYCE